VQTDSVVKCFFTGKNPFFSGEKEAVFYRWFITSEFFGLVIEFDEFDIIF